MPQHRARGLGVVKVGLEQQAFGSQRLDLRLDLLRRTGKTDTEIVAATPSADFDAVYGQGFIQPERFVLMMLAATPR
jgi:hypothetical protein